MQNTYVWRIIPTNQPTVRRSCPKCGSHCEFENSEHFRVNANQSNIDVWLIYQCNKCKSTWNMEILSRMNAGAIDKELYIKYLKNDRALAKQYAFDIATHNRNKSILSYDNITYDIIGESIPLDYEENIQIKLVCDYPLEVRLDKILSTQLGTSREYIKKMVHTGKISGEGIKDIKKAKIKNGMILNLSI